jgi:hypothetical protein
MPGIIFAVEDSNEFLEEDSGKGTQNTNLSFGGAVSTASGMGDLARDRSRE